MGWAILQTSATFAKFLEDYSQTKFCHQITTGVWGGGCVCMCMCGCV